MFSRAEAEKARQLLLDAIDIPGSVKSSEAYISRFKNAIFRNNRPDEIVANPIPPSWLELNSTPLQIGIFSDETQLSGNGQGEIKHTDPSRML